MTSEEQQAKAQAIMDGIENDCLDIAVSGVLESVYTAYFLICVYFGFVGVNLGHYVADVRFRVDDYEQPFLNAYLAFVVLSTIAYFTAVAFLWFYAARFSSNGPDRARRSMNGLLVMFVLHDCPFFFMELSLKVSLDEDKQQTTQYENFVFGSTVASFAISFIPAWLHFLKYASECVEVQLCREDGEIVSFEREVLAGAVEEYGQYDYRTGQFVVASPAAARRVNEVMDSVRRSARRTRGGGATSPGGAVQVGSPMFSGRDRFASVEDAYAAVVSPPKELLSGAAGEDLDEDDDMSASRWRSVVSPNSKFGVAQQRMEDARQQQNDDDGTVPHSGGSSLWSADAVLSPPSLVVERLRHAQAAEKENEKQKKEGNKKGDEKEKEGKGKKKSSSGGSSGKPKQESDSGGSRSSKDEDDDGASSQEQEKVSSPAAFFNSLKNATSGAFSALKKRSPGRDDTAPSPASSNSPRQQQQQQQQKRRKQNRRRQSSRHDDDSSDGIGGGGVSDDD